MALVCFELQGHSQCIRVYWTPTKGASCTVGWLGLGLEALPVLRCCSQIRRAARTRLVP
jgi:hypothetical protein